MQQRRTALTAAEHVELADPNQNGGYINPAPEKRSQRDPYADYFDQQERRNYGEPCHEDHDILGVLSLHEYDHFSPGWGAVLLGTFVLSVFGLCAAVGTVYPDKKSVPKTYPDGLEAELGGKGAVLVGPCLGVCGLCTDCFSGQDSRPDLVEPVSIHECVYTRQAIQSLMLNVSSRLIWFPSCEITSPLRPLKLNIRHCSPRHT
jgi:NADH dehydrogenase (ubiquinone) 1 beta subcomplex subunit 8